MCAPAEITWGTRPDLGDRGEPAIPLSNPEFSRGSRLPRSEGEMLASRIPGSALNRVLRVMLHTCWSAEAWSQVRVEFKKALALRSQIWRAGWFN
jgi:hypothetical protein